ncbi:Nucleolar protein 6 [Cyanidiococcus yangmingshanensis]|uniref:Nucleolar protein 6 n=1 Tax=Cyanidiococcus yangmingshanensis TaxID=2690220 RepID=A0A7J7IQJ4_9RHOD|nr:Nucleolar protein 6 [Cyanidiococcus yangmingshanensis]
MESTHLWPDKVQFPDAAHAVRVAFAIALYRAMERVIQNNPDRLPLPVRFMRVSRRGELHLLFGAFPVCLQIRSAAEVAAELANIRLHAQLASIASRFPAFGSTARLVKRFLAVHSLLDPDGIDGLPPVAVEVLVSRLFTEPLPMANHPATAWGGLVRFLHLIAKHDAAASEALVIVAPELEQEESPWYPETAQDETQMRSMPPRLCLCTSSDPSGTFLTQQVAGEIVHRLRLVSRAALQHLEREIQQGACLELEQLGAVFRSAPLETFCDLVIELEPEAVPAKQPHTETVSTDEAQDTAPKSARFVDVDRDGKNRLLVGVDPVAAYVKWLREMFGSVMVFVRDIYGSCSIGGIWRRHANHEMRFDGNQLSYRRTFAHKASKTANLLEWNVPEMLQDMRRIGCGLVRENSTVPLAQHPIVSFVNFPRRPDGSLVSSPSTPVACIDGNVCSFRSPFVSIELARWEDMVRYVPWLAPR